MVLKILCNIFCNVNSVLFNKNILLIIQNLDINSLVTTVRAELTFPEWSQNNIQYSFVDQGCLTDRVFEFQIKSSFFGQIYLIKKLNRSINLFREVNVFYIKSEFQFNFKFFFFVLKSLL